MGWLKVTLQIIYNICVTLGEKIQKLRKSKGMSQEEFANSLKVSRQAVQKWERDLTIPEIDKLVFISNTFNVSLDQLLKSDSIEEQVENVLNNEGNNTFSKKQILAENNSSTQIQVNEEQGMTIRRVKACKVLLIIGTIISPLSVAGSFMIYDGNPYELLFLLLYLITVPLCCFAISAIKKATTKKEVIGWGIVSLILLSIIGGILILTAPFNGGGSENSKKEKNNSKEEKEKIVESEEEIKYKQLQKYILDYEKTKSYKTLKKIYSLSFLLSSKDYIDSTEIKDKYETIFLNAQKTHKAEIKTTLKIFGIIGIIVSVLLSVLIPVIIVTKNKHKEEVYNEVISLLDNYDVSNHYKINNLIDELYGSKYDVSSLRQKLKGRYSYEKAVEYMGFYGINSEYSLQNIKKYIDSSEENYKKINEIKEDYEKVVNYDSTTKWDVSMNSDYTADNIAETNRNAIAFMYTYANNSKLWNFDYYVATRPIPSLVCGVEFTYENYYFKWYKDESGAHLHEVLPRPSTYNNSTTYTFKTSFTGNLTISNQLMFYLTPKIYYTKDQLNLFRIDEVGYSILEKSFFCKAYLYATGQTITFKQVL